MIDQLVTMDGPLEPEEEKIATLIKATISDEMKGLVEKFGDALERLVEPAVFEKALVWFESPENAKLQKVLPVVQGYLKSLDTEFQKTVQARLAGAITELEKARDERLAKLKVKKVPA